MRTFDDIFHWKGWGGALQLASGRCRLRIFDLSQPDESNRLTVMKPIVVVVSDLPRERINDLSVRSCSGHVATMVVHRFGLDPQRMVWVEYTPGSAYGQESQHTIADRFETVDFDWREGRALNPKWRPVPESLLRTIVPLLAE